MDLYDEIVMKSCQKLKGDDEFQFFKLVTARI